VPSFLHRANVLEPLGGGMGGAVRRLDHGLVHGAGALLADGQDPGEGGAREFAADIHPLGTQSIIRFLLFSQELAGSKSRAAIYCAIKVSIFGNNKFGICSIVYTK